MFKRVFDFFKRDKAKREVKPVVIESPVEVKKIPEKDHVTWITRWVRHSKDKKLAKEIASGRHIAHPRHIIKPLKHNFHRTDFSKSADVHIDRLLGKIPSRKAERIELGLINPAKG